MLYSTLVASLLLAPLAICQAPETVKVGSTPKFQFQAEPFNGAGVKSLEALRGKPTMIEFWGTA